VKYIVVFDTNILLSALFSQNGNPFRCLTLAKIGQIESVICQEILDEFVEKLLLKFNFSEEKTQAAIQEVKVFSRLVTISNTKSGYARLLFHFDQILFKQRFWRLGK